MTQWAGVVLHRDAVLAQRRGVRGAVGALALAVISNAITVLGAPVFVTDFLTGALLLAALAAEMLSGRPLRRSRTSSPLSNRKETQR